VSEGPIVVGGNGHSGTRIFIDVVTAGGCFSGITHVTKRKASQDLKIFGLLNKWVEPYVYGKLGTREAEQMRRAFARRLRLYFPFRGRSWGFKNPRTMLILPFLDELLPGMRFVHVVRDGRDIALGNPFVGNNRYVDAHLEAGERALPDAEKMILFWGRSNEAAMRYGEEHMKGRYTLMRWEDMCFRPLESCRKLLEFSRLPPDAAPEASRLVAQPKSIGRWKTFATELREPVHARGMHWLRVFGYV
jgi:hypothetical protein